MKTLYQKYNDGDSLTDSEVVEGAKFFWNLDNELRKAGPEFYIMAREARRVAMGLESYAQAKVNNVDENKKLRSVAAEFSHVYITADMHIMQREYAGRSPNGTLFNGSWVLRGPKGEFIGHDEYQLDLAQRYGFDFV